VSPDMRISPLTSLDDQGDGGYEERHAKNLRAADDTSDLDFVASNTVLYDREGL